MMIQDHKNVSLLRRAIEIQTLLYFYDLIPKIFTLFYEGKPGRRGVFRLFCLLKRVVSFIIKSFFAVKISLSPSHKSEVPSYRR